MEHLRPNRAFLALFWDNIKVLVFFTPNLFYLANENFKKGGFGSYDHVLVDNVVVVTSVDELSIHVEPDGNFVVNWGSVSRKRSKHFLLFLHYPIPSFAYVDFEILGLFQDSINYQVS